MTLFEVVGSALTRTCRIATSAVVLCCDGIVARDFRSGVPPGPSAVTVSVAVGGFAFCTCRGSADRSGVGFGEIEEQRCTLRSVQAFVVTRGSLGFVGGIFLLVGLLRGWFRLWLCHSRSERVRDVALPYCLQRFVPVLFCGDTEGVDIDTDFICISTWGLGNEGEFRGGGRAPDARRFLLFLMC